MNRLEGKVALITGAASGIGLACATRFAAEGAIVVGTDIAEPRDNGWQTVADAAPDTLFLTLDVSDDAAVAATVETIVGRFGRIDVLLNAAGVVGQGAADAVRLDIWDRTMAINLNGSFYTARHVAPQMVHQRSGSIINIASIFGMAGCDNNLAYNVSKGGVVQLTRSLAADYGWANVRSNCLCPGLIDTPMTEMVRENEAFHAYFASQHMLQRAGRPDEVAAAALFLASEDASFVSGQMLMVDGGFSAARRFAPPPEAEA
ncbi:SDR family NAD(P)-dependent oxidoreductase [Marinobacterium aestuariivivens]|uniref:SDR family NAD(P)-dependent oxidoreductase n=1 Tax=Marinobacterium aestuariivivens TaxID=1698799 RepID=A0ABW2A431_9GAMM